VLRTGPRARVEAEFRIAWSAAGVEHTLDRFYYDHLSFQRDLGRTGVRIPDPGRSLYLNFSIAFE
jgi:iron complex outermembrane receptor protein